ncbi:MAG: DUF4338 domain-containing protein [Spirochaetaceae bacterium]|nr:DUF4338 domain-containing protein [Spirochaetaceae bacterium]
MGEIQQLKLVLVQTTDDIRIWNELMINEHPLGAGPLVGRQVRYLISSEYGWLGGFGFAAPALQLADRDKWIGWNSEQHKKFLHFIVGMSRFLIRPSVNCQNLASKVLSMSINRLVSDFEKRYNYKPLLLESFVDSNYSGTCYKASNWIKIGKTKGRGRQDRFNQYALSIKTIYVYPIENDFRRQMGLSENAGLGALKILMELTLNPPVLLLCRYPAGRRSKTTPASPRSTERELINYLYSPSAFPFIKNIFQITLSLSCLQRQIMKRDLTVSLKNISYLFNVQNLLSLWFLQRQQ